MDAHIEQDQVKQDVVLNGGASARDITQIGKLVQIVLHPAKWQDALWGFVSKNRRFVIALGVLMAALLSTYLSFKNLYLIPWWRCALAIVFLISATWGWYRWRWPIQRWPSVITPLLATSALVALVGWQSWQIAFPARFAPQVFGIAVAEFGGQQYRPTSSAEDISDQVYEQLCAAIKLEFGTQPGEDPCARSTSAAGERRVALMRLGIVPSSQVAKAYGERIAADLVIWGQVLESQNEAMIRFHVSETLDRAVNPNFPLILPVTLTSPEVFAHELNSASSPIALKEKVAQQSTLISSFALGLAAYLDRDFAKAVARFEAAARTIEANPELKISSEGQGLLYFYLGNALYARNQIEAGQAWLQRAQAVSREEPAIPLSIGLGYASLGKLQERDIFLQQAQSLIQKCLDANPQNNAARYDQGIIFQALHAQEAAIADFEQIIAQDPDYYVAYINLGQAYAQLRQADQAEQAYQHAIELAQRTGTNASWAHLNLAMVYQQSGKPDLARAAFQRAIEVDPQTDWMYYYYAQFLDRQNEIDAAWDTYHTMIDVTQNKAWAYRKMADFLRSHGLLQAALQSYGRAIQAQSADPLTRAYLAETYFALGDTESAEREFEALVKQQVTIPYIYASYAWELLQRKQYERAAEMYTRALALQPVDAMSLSYLGHIYEIVGKPEQAKACYQRILSYQEQVSEQFVQDARERLRALGVENPQP